MAEYKQLSGGGVERLADGAQIPTDLRNGDYREYLAWVALGNTPEPVDPPLISYCGQAELSARIRTTDATLTELFRCALATNTMYASTLELVGIDAGNGNRLRVKAEVTVTRVGGTSFRDGITVTINHRVNSAAWVVDANVSGNFFVITVQGAAGRTIDWTVMGPVRRFAPAGLTD